MFSRQFIRLAARTLPKGGQRMFSTQMVRKTGKSPFFAMALTGVAGGAVLVCHTLVIYALPSINPSVHSFIYIYPFIHSFHIASNKSTHCYKLAARRLRDCLESCSAHRSKESSDTTTYSLTHLVITSLIVQQIEVVSTSLRCDGQWLTG